MKAKECLILKMDKKIRDPRPENDLSTRAVFTFNQIYAFILLATFGTFQMSFFYVNVPVKYPKCPWGS